MFHYVEHCRCDGAARQQSAGQPWRASGAVRRPSPWPLTLAQADRSVNRRSWEAGGNRRIADWRRLTRRLNASVTDSRYCFLMLSLVPAVNGTRRSLGPNGCTLPGGRLGVVMPRDVTMPMSAPATVAAGPVPHPHGGPVPGRCLVVGVVSVTPDSFSDVGKSFHPEQAVERGMELMRLGADIIDVGGQSTRPGAAPVPLAEERRRMLPVVTALAGAGAVARTERTKHDNRSKTSIFIRWTVSAARGCERNLARRGGCPHGVLSSPSPRAIGRRRSSGRCDCVMAAIESAVLPRRAISTRRPRPIFRRPAAAAPKPKALIGSLSTRP